MPAAGYRGAVTVHRSRQTARRVVQGTFLTLAACVAAVAPLPLVVKSSAITLLAYLAFAAGGMPWAYLTALVAPPVGLLTGDPTWLVMLPIVLSGLLLGMLALEYAWSWPAAIVSPIALIAPHVTTLVMARQDLFRLDLPWDPGAEAWIVVHLLAAVAGVLTALLLHRRSTVRR